MAKAELKARLSADTKPFGRSLQGAQGRVAAFKSRLATIGPGIVAAFGIGAIIAFTRSVINAGSTITDLAGQAGLSVEAFQVFSEVAKDAGTKISLITKAIGKLAIEQGKALRGEKLFEKEFKSLGITFEDLSKLNTQQLFLRIADSLTDSKFATEQFSAAAEILGSGPAIKLREVFETLTTETFPDVQATMLETGRIMSEETAVKMDEAADKIQAAMTRLQNTLATALGNTITFLEDIFTNLGAVTAVGFEETARQITEGEAGFEQLHERFKDDIGGIDSEAAKKAVETEKRKQDDIRRLQEREAANSKKIRDKEFADAARRTGEIQKLGGLLGTIGSRLNPAFAPSIPDIRNPAEIRAQPNVVATSASETLNIAKESLQELRGINEKVDALGTLP